MLQREDNLYRRARIIFSSSIVIAKFSALCRSAHTVFLLIFFLYTFVSIASVKKVNLLFLSSYQYYYCKTIKHSCDVYNNIKLKQLETSNDASTFPKIGISPVTYVSTIIRRLFTFRVFFTRVRLMNTNKNAHI